MKTLNNKQSIKEENSGVRYKDVLMTLIAMFMILFSISFIDAQAQTQNNNLKDIIIDLDAKTTDITAIEHLKLFRESIDTTYYSVFTELSELDMKPSKIFVKSTSFKDNYILMDEKLRNSRFIQDFDILYNPWASKLGLNVGDVGMYDVARYFLKKVLEDGTYKITADYTTLYHILILNAVANYISGSQNYDILPVDEENQNKFLELLKQPFHIGAFGDSYVILVDTTKLDKDKFNKFLYDMYFKILKDTNPKDNE